MIHSRLLQTLSGLQSPTVLVVGDLILDNYITGDASRISPEAPIPVLRVQPGVIDNRLGGAGNVAANLASLGAKTLLAGLIGNDATGAAFLEELERVHLPDALILRDLDRPTTTKTRFISGSQQILRSDVESRRPIGAELAAELIQRIEALLPSVDLVILSDYGKGVLSSTCCAALIQTARAAGKPVLVDPKGKDYGKYAGATLLTPNRSEASEAAAFLGLVEEELPEIGRGLGERLGCKQVIFKLGAKGLGLCLPDGSMTTFPTEARSVFDVTGAGDTLIATLGFCLAAGAPLEDALRLANVAAGVVVGRMGTVAIGREEIRQALLRGASPAAAKIHTAQDVSTMLQDLRARGKRIVFTNGCFDLLHVGHVRYLSFARNQGDLLVIGLNSDASVRRLKGETRPLLPLEQRAELLAALEDVDYVVPFEEDDPESLIRLLQPDVLVKGEDWRERGAVGADIVTARGGQVLYAPMTDGVSTSNIVRDVLARGRAAAPEAN